MENITCANLLAKGIVGEAEAIKIYGEDLLQHKANLSDDDFAEIEKLYAEIIADELNHIGKLFNAYEEITGITAKVD